MVTFPIVLQVSGVDAGGNLVIVTLELDANGQTKVRDVTPAPLPP